MRASDNEAKGSRVSRMCGCFGMSSDQLSGQDKYLYVGELGAGRKGEIKLMKHIRSKELVAVKYIARVVGEGLSKNTEREIVNHRKLLHPNIIRFKEVFYTDDHLAIVMEYASEGHLSNRIKLNGRLAEDDARRFFQQLVEGVEHCHSQGVVHRDLRLEHLLLDGNFMKPTLKITGFGYSKSNILDSLPKTTVGAPTYTPPEVLMSQNASSYDGKLVDVWSCGVILYLMVTGSYPFQEQGQPGVLTRKMMQNVMHGRFSWPRGIQVSNEVRDLVRGMLQPDPTKRLTVERIKEYKWFQQGYQPLLKMGSPSAQTDSEIISIVQRARIEKAPSAVERAASPFSEDEVWHGDI